MEITAILTIDNENDIGNDIDYDIKNNSEMTITKIRIITGNL